MSNSIEQKPLSSNIKPHVSVVIPVYNGATFLHDAIVSCVSQSDAAFFVEVIVVDDGSTDNSCQIAYGATKQVTLIRHPANRGRHVARNTGLAVATGDYVKFLDQDDFLEPDTLQAEFELARNTDSDIVIAGHRSVARGADGQLHTLQVRREPPQMEPRIRAILDGAAVPTSAALYRRTYIEGLSWDGSVPRLDDWDWFVRAALRMGKITPMPHVSYSWNHHEGQFTHRSSLQQYARDHHAILRKIEQWLRDHNELDSQHKARLAQYYYKMLRAIYTFDHDWYRKTFEHIRELDPAFFPYCEPRREVRWLCRAVGVRAGLSVYNQAADAMHCIRSLTRN